MNRIPDARSPTAIENRTFDEVAVGDSASLSRKVTQGDIDLFAVASGEVSFAPRPLAGGGGSAAPRVLADGMLGAGLIARLVAGRLPGPGAVILATDLTFHNPVAIGEDITATVSVLEKHPASLEIVLDCRCVTAAGTVVISGRTRVRAPTEKVHAARLESPDVRFSRHERFRELISEETSEAPLATAVAHPCDADSLVAAVEAARAGLITPILVGPRPRIEKAAQAAGVDLSGFRLIDTAHSAASAAEAVALVRRGEAALLMKGSLHTDELLHEVLAPDTGLRAGRWLSHVYLMDVPAYPRPLLLTDAAVNITPDLEQKRDIIQNAVDLAHVMGIARPRVAILCAVETVNPRMRSTLDAAALCKMADRGQITGALVDGPLAFDNAVSPEAARMKGIVSEVAGLADILVAPDLEAGNMLAKQLTFMAGADAAGVVLGARVPIILTSRADAERTRMASCAVAVRIARRRAAAAASAVGA